MANGNHIIFIHPDGTSLSHDAIARFLALNTINSNTEIGFGGQTLAIVRSVTNLDVNISFIFT
ncbi:hypothetical protein [Tolypothrix sp. PCC 7910]|uniref:hypothetical protein n=1 Tax=Tolypothrix sp. PCC 7910 TaxID=2099387 RepID=UPI00143062C7|nr:hypothetical protein [Tolypothrix sp. PCC 7910]